MATATRWTWKAAPIPSNDRDGYMQAIDRDVIKKEARQIAERLLHEQTIAMEAWGEVAAEYHRRKEPFTSAFVPHLLHHKYLSLKDENESSYLKEKSVLDVAARTGAGALCAISKGASFAMATNFSENILQVLQNWIRDHDCALPRGILGTSVARGPCLPLAWENKYDVVLSNFGCISFSRVDQGLREMVRCAKTGGKVCLSAWGSKEETHSFNVFPAAIKRCGLDRYTWIRTDSEEERGADHGRRPCETETANLTTPSSAWSWPPRAVRPLEDNSISSAEVDLPGRGRPTRL